MSHRQPFNEPGGRFSKALDTETDEKKPECVQKLAGLYTCHTGRDDGQ